MPHRIELISHLLEVLFLNFINFIILLTFMNVLASIPIILSIIYSLGKIKRDIEKYHNGSIKEYATFLLGKAKKN